MSAIHRAINYAQFAVSNFFRIPTSNMPRILFHALILSVIIGAFWLLDTIKDPLFATIVGIEYQPTAKLLSVVSTVAAVMVYDHLTSLVSKPTLFYIVSGTYGLLFLLISGSLPNHHAVGESGTTQYYSQELGWIAFFAIESYGSMMVALFWSFTNSIMDLEEAKGAYGLILSIAQTGAIIGSTLASNAKDIGYPSLFLIGSMLSLSVTLLIKLYHIVFVDEVTVATSSRVRTWTDDEENIRGIELRITGLGAVAAVQGESVAPRALPAVWKWIIVKFGGFCEGLTLIYHHKYVMRIFAVSCFYEIVVTVLDYEFKMLGAGSLEPSHSSQENSGDSFKFAHLMGKFGQMTNLLTMVVSLFGFSFFVNTFGVRASLMIFPSLLLTAVILTNLVPSLWVLFFVVSILKASAYSLNDPVKELLYQPTNVPIKYKAKAWIDVFGSRLAKAGGSFISHLAHGSVSKLQLVSELPSFAISIILLVLAWQAGTQFQYLVANNLVVGECTSAEENGEVPISGHRKSGFAADSTIGRMPDQNGLHPGDVGYAGYDPDAVFEGVNFDNLGNVGALNKFGSFVGSTKRQLNNDIFRAELNTKDTTPRRFRKIKLKNSQDAPNSPSVAVQQTDVCSVLPKFDDEGRIRSESADF